MRGHPPGVSLVLGAAAGAAASSRPRSHRYALYPAQLRVLDRAARERARGTALDARAAAPDKQRVLGPDHPDTLLVQHGIARWTGLSGDPIGALHLFQDLLPEMRRALGPGHPDTLATRHYIADLTGICGDSLAALTLFRDLLTDTRQFLGPDHPSTLAMHDNIAHRTGQDPE